MSKKTERKFNNDYYNSILLQFLGMEAEIEIHTQHSLSFFYMGFTYILWCGANKIQVKETAEWIYDADRFIIDRVLKENKPPYLNQIKS